MLSFEGYLVTQADSGERALASVAAEAPDLILLDAMMPGIDGFEVTARVKRDPATQNIPVIMITAVDHQDARIRALTAGAEDFLTKPVDRIELHMRVRNHLRLKAYGDLRDQHRKTLEGEVGSRTADLVASERLYRSTFDEAPVGIVHVGLDGRWLRVNQRICDLLGYSRDDLQGRSTRDLARSEATNDEVDAWRQMVAGTLDRHVVEEKQYRRNDGSFVVARLKTSIHRDADGKARHFISVIEDITARKQSEEALRRSEEQLRQSQKMEAVGGLAGGVAHDFNNLLSVILSYSELLADGLVEGDPLRADLEEIHGAGLRAADLTRQLLAFSRQQTLQPEVVELHAIVIGMDKMLRRLIGEDVALTTTTGSAIGRVLVDPRQVEQVIMNLVVNARDAMPQGGKLTIETANVFLDHAYADAHAGITPGPHVMLAVSDTGAGMTAATQARIFEPFFTTKAAGKGTGLGLATVFGIVQQSGGSLGVSSELGVGTTFTIHFPRVDRALHATTSIAPLAAQALRGAETILLVEDEERVRGVACAILRKYGYNVLEAENGGEALLLCEQHVAKIDLLLTDVVMPRMSGRQLAERLVSIHPEMKVLYMSGYTDDAVMRHGIQDSTVAFLQKPITPDTLARKVRVVLDAAGGAPC